MSMAPSRIFPHHNNANFLCPVCKTNADRPVILLPIPGTEKDCNVECRPVHAECWRLVCIVYLGGNQKEAI
jgi:hypothetical protein